MEERSPETSLQVRRETVAIFRARLLEAMARAAMKRAELARKSGIDRSTLSQLLSPDNDRLPRADTAARFAQVLRVSLDWLLGLSHESRPGAEVMEEFLRITPSARAPVDENLARWHEEAAGYKIRYVPATLPDFVKTEPVLEYEFVDYVGKTVDQAIAASHGRLDYTRLPETDMEVCMPRQALEAFARGEGRWGGLSSQDRAAQLERIAALCDELYPSLRLYLFDALTHYSAPYTIFGPHRAAVYIGQMYLVFTTTQQIRGLTRHFDELIRAAVVQAPEAARFARGLAAGVSDG